MIDDQKTKEQLIEELARERESSLALAEVSKRVSSAHDTNEILELIVHEATRLLNATGAFMRLLDTRGLVRGVTTKAVAGLYEETLEANPVFVVGDGSSTTGTVMATRTAFSSEDITVEARLLPKTRELTQKYGVHGAMQVPLVANDVSIGVLSVCDERIRKFTDDEISLVSAFADQAALALEKARLLDEAERETARSDALYRVSNLLAGAHNTDEVLDLIVNESKRLLGLSSVVIRLLEENSLVLRASTSTLEGYTPEPDFMVEEGTSLPGHVMATKKPLFGEDAAPLLPRRQKLMNETGLDPAVLGTVPLLANDQSIGTLTVADNFHHGRRFSEDEISLLMAFADQAALTLEKARLLADAETERERAESLYRISNLLAGAHDMDEVLDLIVNEAARLVGAPNIGIRLLEGDMLVSRAVTPGVFAGLAPSLKMEDINDAFKYMKEGTNLVGHVMATQKPLFGEDAAQMLANGTRLMFENSGLDLASAGVVPLVANDKSIGTLTVMDGTHNRRFTEDEISLLTAFADQAALALDKARLLDEAEQARDEAEEANETLSHFLANMSHNLRTPLNAIIGYSDMLKEEAEDSDNEEFKEDLERINGAGKRLLSLVNYVLDVAKIETGAMEIELETFPVHLLVQDVVTTMQTLVENNSNVLEIDCPDSVGSIHADTTKIKQCLFNLIDNAAKFTEQGTISLTVSRDTKEGQEWVNFAVGDTGIGMTDDQMGRLFEAFAQEEASTTRQFGGTGLGLAITRHLCEMMGGAVLVESELGKGSTFTMKLPAVVEGP